MPTTFEISEQPSRAYRHHVPFFRANYSPSTHTFLRALHRNTKQPVRICICITLFATHCSDCAACVNLHHLRACAAFHKQQKTPANLTTARDALTFYAPDALSVQPSVGRGFDSQSFQRRKSLEQSDGHLREIVLIERTVSGKPANVFRRWAAGGEH